MGKAKKIVSPSEVHAYSYILDQLIKKKGWNRPETYTQQECHKIPEIGRILGQNKPENVVDIDGKNYYIVEAKNERKKIDQSLKEAKEDYADKINAESRIIRAPFVTGIAGNSEEGYIARSQFLINGKWETIKENGIEITGLLSKVQVQDILQSKEPHLEDVEITEEEFLQTALKINEILYENSIQKDYRAKFISAILLAMSDNKEIDISQDFDVLVENINSRVKSILHKHNKPNFSNFIKIDEPSSRDNHVKIRDAIKRTYQELLNLNISSAMNSGKDVLGKFYEVFLKYGNGAKDIGIVLTPRHITKFAAQVLDITHNDLVLDPACGTGGFLVSALDEVRRKSEDVADFDTFRLHGLYGIENQDAVISLALVNMIFRGDGKNNMIEGDCFKNWLNVKSSKVYQAEFLKEDTDHRILPITKVMMNPPFALKKRDEKEYRFVEHALKQMQNQGILFTVLPISVLIEKGTKKWRKDVLLKNNRLLAVITFPEDLFYPVSVGTLGLFVKKGIPHDYDKHKVYFARCIHDGLTKKKGVRKESKKVRNMLEEIREELKEFISEKDLRIDSIPIFKKVCLLDKNDKSVELAPEGYIDDKAPTLADIQKGLEEMIREAVAFKIKYKEKLEEIR